MRRKTSEKPNSVLRGVTAVVRLVLFAVLGALLVMALSETSAVTNLFSGRRGEDPLVGLVAGHWQSDSGAVCADGLQEVDLNLQIARAVADALRAQGYRVEVLPEYSPKLDGLQAAVFLAIHNDSCMVDLSGFKVAAMTQGDADNAETELVNLLYAHYEQATGLKPHPDTITDDMRQYHALRKIAPETPGAIIECGFMGGDRTLLTEQQGRVVTGIADGLRAFLRREQ
jgi:N-acetylmuramoyl-L-alanine amidase